MSNLNFIVDREKCIHCDACVKDCPRRIIQSRDTYPGIPADLEEKCIRCQHCLAICPTGAISIFGLKPEDSIPLEPKPSVSPEALSRFMRSRRTIRQYREENVDRKLIDKLLVDIAYAPTGGNTCDLTFTVVDDRLTLRGILEKMVCGLEAIPEKTDMPEFIPQAVQSYRHSNADMIFRGAPHLLIASAGENAYCGDADVVIALSYFELLAQSHGLGTTWCDFLKFILNFQPELGTLFGIPVDRPYRAILFGLPAIHYARTVQRDHAARVRTIHSQE